VKQDKFRWQANYGKDENLDCNGLDQKQVQLEGRSKSTATVSAIIINGRIHSSLQTVLATMNGTKK
jgi:hypothetical protein